MCVCVCVCVCVCTRSLLSCSLSCSLRCASDGTQPIEHNSCGASVISDRFIVTSAYCVINRNITMVRLGDIDLARDNETNSNPSDYGVIDVILPPEFT
ncbi:hypothetical protein E2C01_063028 [Portunus trituberculatus]|uniref:Peptidase S1 domain-containing protein n=1 Tax=Portunus trituberculatus TaxID=210409 RepID=A0A5B7HJ58_PORTR|nr:hypothetical protein [Portunus trituberculatus]